MTDFEKTVLEVKALDGDARRRAREAALAGAVQVQRGRRRLLAQGSAAVVTLVAGGVLTYSALFPASAYASWTAVPHGAAVAMDDARLQPCLSSIPAEPGEVVDAARFKPLVAEGRGDFTAVLLGDESSVLVCIYDQDNRSTGRVDAEALPTGSSVKLLGNGGSLDKGDGARYVFGPVAAGVSSVKVTTTDGTEVTASVADGYFLAWWPAPAGPVSVTALDRSNTVLQELIP
ncbi:hypothetical protein HPO96_18410 [Kribbella sandramycini]|uniref:Uncharacterized protein n=1 Tax=Kribbella sandramycini TaxID=60450 RepID=A0A7Y4L2D7_9ACTN|nr:hypothetical protein [Kribbella sandramycini]MBB6564518.1 hypothetical protein [Kribbella sandramycini]NOL42222.1 hypothetical protein [Kribbella sandramycini]